MSYCNFIYSFGVTPHKWFWPWKSQSFHSSPLLFTLLMVNSLYSQAPLNDIPPEKYFNLWVGEWYLAWDDRASTAGTGFNKIERSSMAPSSKALPFPGGIPTGKGEFYLLRLSNISYRFKKQGFAQFLMNKYVDNEREREKQRFWSSPDEIKSRTCNPKISYLWFYRHQSYNQLINFYLAKISLFHILTFHSSEIWYKGDNIQWYKSRIYTS